MSGIGAFIRKSMYLEPVMVWSLGLYGTGIAMALVVPSVRSSFATEAKPKTPPSLKEVMAGIQAKLNH